MQTVSDYNNQTGGHLSLSVNEWRRCCITREQENLSPKQIRCWNQKKQDVYSGLSVWCRLPFFSWQGNMSTPFLLLGEFLLAALSMRDSIGNWFTKPENIKAIILVCPLPTIYLAVWQINRWPCHWVTLVTFDFGEEKDRQLVVRELPRRLVTVETFNQSD